MKKENKAEISSKPTVNYREGDKWEEDKYLRRWLGKKTEGTRATYLFAIEKFVAFTGMTPEELIDEKWKDMQKHPHEREDVAEQRLADFHTWLLEGYEKYGRYAWKGEKKVSENTAKGYYAGIRSFYKANGVPLDMSGFGRGRFGASPRKRNKTVKLEPDQVETLAYYAPTLRDKAIIWLMYQSGMDISTTLSLTEGDVMEELVSPPLTEVEIDGKLMQVPSVKIESRREKLGRGEQAEVLTFIGKRAIEALTKYLTEKHGEGWAEKLEYKRPLFQGRNMGLPLGKARFMGIMRKIAPKAEIANSRLKYADWNLLRSHGLRASFQKQMKDAKAPEEFVHYLVTHKTKYKGAYTDVSEERLRRDYCRYGYVALEPREVTSAVEGRLKEQETAVGVVSRKLADAMSELEGLRPLKGEVEELRKLVKRYRDEYGEIAHLMRPDESIKEVTLARAVEAKGGLPVEVARKIVDRWMEEEVMEMEAEEWAEDTVRSVQKPRKKR